MEKTIKNLTTAFVGESQARNNYTKFAKVAKNEGYELISDIFLEIANQEREHAKWLLNMLNGIKDNNDGDLDVELSVSTNTEFGDTAFNLNKAISGETYEFEDMYPTFANIAEEEGFLDIAKRLRAIAVAEEHHKDRFKKLLVQLESDNLSKNDEEVSWVCKKCGYVHKGTERPQVCPSCSHPKSYFKNLNENFD